MSAEIKNLSPQPVWGYFYDLTQIPRPTGHMEAVTRFMVAFGKGLGCHGAAILGSVELRDYLINFARSFIYTTGLSPHSVATILVAYQHLKQDSDSILKLRENIISFNQQ